MSSIVLNPWRILTDIWHHRYLLGQLIKRDVLLRYRGAMFGVQWIFLARWPQQDLGLITFNDFAETVSRL